uniref:Uncharacterized protein n=1 Tax=Parascaris equorum TaxID=6256 RepID=A0A914SDL3_PAREQ
MKVSSIQQIRVNIKDMLQVRIHSLNPFKIITK